MLDKLLKISVLFDFYGALLTEKQRRCLEMHFLNDLSLSEIADQFGVSRQAVYDIVHRSEQVLEEYEKRLGLVERYRREKQEIQAIYDAVEWWGKMADSLLSNTHKFLVLVCMAEPNRILCIDRITKSMKI